jgi:hypothetical protein
MAIAILLSLVFILSLMLVMWYSNDLVDSANLIQHSSRRDSRVFVLFRLVSNSNRRSSFCGATGRSDGETAG